MIDNLELYIVGGYVRDKLLGIESNDIDIVLVPKSNVNLEFEKAINYFLKQGYELIFKSLFFTAKFRKDNLILDLTVARKENYEYNGALPKVEITGSLYEDLKRRDFTINAIAMDFKGNIIDIFNGIEHLRKRILIPINSFLDDPTRIFRAIKYAKKYNLTYTRKLINQISRARRHLKNVSFSRKRKELGLISIEKDRVYMWMDILKFRIFPNLSFKNIVFEIDKIIPYTEGSWVLFYIAFLDYAISLAHITKLEREIIETFRTKRVLNKKNETYETAKYILKLRGLL
ncbi:MAG: hypothetical protein N2504_03600 [candidate division WOR-3 bacterium]|nr:hypothetical protein [candidate division WOR-3 bacterium]MCX7947652.1 hypothetical protein [candidate division WOR-3 bacterium]MDW8150530.1 hypothetical protein [candidate division WOR-3 bacterium]